MVTGCGVLVLLCCIHQSLSAATSTSPLVKTQNDHDDSEAQEFEPDHEFYQVKDFPYQRQAWKSFFLLKDSFEFLCQFVSR